MSNECCVSAAGYELSDVMEFGAGTGGTAWTRHHGLGPPGVKAIAADAQRNRTYILYKIIMPGKSLSAKQLHYTRKETHAELKLYCCSLHEQRRTQSSGAAPAARIPTSLPRQRI